MITEDMIEDFISAGVHAYKINAGDCLEARKLNRHEPVNIGGQEFSYWRELAVYRMAEYVCKIIPDAKIEVTLDGNDSILKIEVDDLQEEKLKTEISLFFQKVNEIKNRKRKFL